MFHSPYVRREGGSDVTTRSKAERLKGEIEFLRSDIERLLMITEALWTILKEKFGYSDEELLRRVYEIDFRDGKLDGRVARTEAPVCPHCKRTMSKNRPLCLWCGKPVKTDLFQR